MTSLTNGATYQVNSQRKGKFVGRLISHDDTWATLEVTQGKAGAMRTYNEVEVGGQVTVRCSMCSFEELNAA